MVKLFHTNQVEVWNMTPILESIERAEKILLMYRSETEYGGTDFSLARDVITDLLHLVEENKLGLPEDLVETAVENFIEEQSAEHPEFIWENQSKKEKEKSLDNPEEVW